MYTIEFPERARVVSVEHPFHRAVGVIVWKTPIGSLWGKLVLRRKTEHPYLSHLNSHQVVRTEDVTWDWKAVEESLTTAELLVSKILLTNDGRQALKVMYQYMQQNANWTLTAIGRKGDYLVVPPRSLLHTMFHIGNRQFDQYLAGSWPPDWSTLLHSPLGLSREKVWKQLQKRPEFSEFKSDPKRLSQHDLIVVQKMTEMFMQEEVKSASDQTLNATTPSSKSNTVPTPHSKSKQLSQDTSKVTSKDNRTQNVAQNYKTQPPDMNVDKTCEESTIEENFKLQQLDSAEKSGIGGEKKTDPNAPESASNTKPEINVKSPNPETSTSTSKKSTREHSSKSTKAKDKSVKE